MDKFNVSMTAFVSVFIAFWLVFYIVLMVRLNKDYNLSANHIDKYADFSIYASIIVTEIFAVLSLLFVMIQAIGNKFDWLLLVGLFIGWILIVAVPILGNVNAANALHKINDRQGYKQYNNQKLTIVNSVALIYGVLIFGVHLYLVFADYIHS